MTVTLYLWAKAFHILAVIAWMAALLYLPRLFSYHVKTGGEMSPSHAVFVTMERRLLKIIATPAMLAVWLFGLILAAIPGVIDWSAVWPWIKLAGIFTLTAFHFWLAAQRRDLEAGRCIVGERRFRLMNEVPSVIAVLIVIMIVVRPF
ncbi:MAG: CopD family protein [Rhodobacteraceae bacterium]|nr:CopD family protein [Paracoccaceae bacterium]